MNLRYTEFSSLFPAETFIKRIVFTLFITAVFCIRSAAEEPASWVLAAEPFELKNVPEVHAGHAENIPLMILSRLSRISLRKVAPEEIRSRKMRDLQDDRITLLLERNALIQKSDMLILSDSTRQNIQKQRRDIANQIVEKEQQIDALEQEIAVFEESEEDAAAILQNLTLWKDGTELYVRNEEVSLSRSLAKDGISGLLHGTIEDIGGYFIVSVSLDTGYGHTHPVLIREAMPYDDLQEILYRINRALLPSLTNSTPVSLHLAVDPPEASVFIDDRLVVDHTEPVVVFSGEHSIQVSAPGFEFAGRTAVFDVHDRYSIQISLDKISTVQVAFDTKTQPAEVYFQTKHFGTTALVAELPAETLIGEAVQGDIKTYFLYPHDDNAKKETRSMIIPLNRQNTEQRIEKQRKVLYWSLGLLYCSLPFSMLSNGIAQNKARAYEDGKISGTSSQLDEINRWLLVSDITRGVSIALGVNFLFQLVRYVIAADQTIPSYAVEQLEE